MAISEETLSAIRRAYQIWAEHQGDDVSAILDLMAEDVEVTTLPDGIGPADLHQGLPQQSVEMTEYFHALIGDWQLLRADILERWCVRGNVVVLVLTTKWRNRRTDKEFESPAAHVWRFRDGFACQIRLFFDSAKWSRPRARGGGHLPDWLICALDGRMHVLGGVRRRYRVARKAAASMSLRVPAGGLVGEGLQDVGSLRAAAVGDEAVDAVWIQ